MYVAFSRLTYASTNLKSTLLHALKGLSDSDMIFIVWLRDAYLHFSMYTSNSVSIVLIF